MNDEQIVGLYFARAEAALTETEAQYGRLCLSVARRILPDERDAEECASDALLRAWNAIPPERPRSLGAYLARLTRNLALDRYAYNQAEKRSTALTGAFEELEPFLPDAADSLQQAAECAELGDWHNAEVFSRRAEADWNKWEHFRACFADHTPTEEVGAELAAMETARQERETADFAASCARAAKMVQAVGDAHALCWWNLL